MTAGLRRRARALRRLGALPRADLRRLVLAQWYLVRARLALAFAARGRLLAEPAGSSHREGAAEPIPEATLQQASLAVARAAEFGLFPPTCLVRSMALERMLLRAGVREAVVRIGVRRNGSRTEMHAWVEIDGAVVGDRPERARTFTPLHDFTGAGRA
jgi:Transglutaminase-like superfamily